MLLLPSFMSAMDKWAAELRAFPPHSLSALHTQLAVLMVVSGAATFLALLFGPTAPYGRYARPGWGPMIDSRIAWLTQEIPSLIVCAAICWQAGITSFTQHPTSLRTLATALFLVHYIWRSVLYPMCMRSAKRTAASVWAMAIVFCTWNGFLQGYMLAYKLPVSLQVTPVTGALLVCQAALLLATVHADLTLIGLRKPGETDYKIPYGGLFRYVSAANYSAEIMEWSCYATAIGLAVPAAALAPVAFAWFVFCNLSPRGWKHHQWYLAKFKDTYPKRRKAVIPGLW